MNVPSGTGPRDDSGSAGHGSSGSTNLSGSRVSTRDPLTHDHVNKFPRSSDILCQLPPFTTIQSILLVQYACLTVLNNNLSPGPRLSSSRSGTLYFILHFFTQSSSFRNTCPHYHSLFAVLAMLSVLVLENLTLTLKPLTFHSRNARSIS